MNPVLAELLHGAGLSDIVIPRQKFIKEHKHLVGLLNQYDIPALRKEAKDQSEELQALQGGTHRENVLRSYKIEDKPYSIQELSTITSVPANILQEVYNRGIGAYSSSPKSVRLKGSYVKNVDAPMSKKLSKEQWAMARVYSFIDGNEKHDEDLRSNRGGKMSAQSGFIRRLMAENSLKHDGQYKYPVWKLHKDSTMDEPFKFNYEDIANPAQRGTNTHKGKNPDNYGASPFIQKHFGTNRAVAFVRGRKHKRGDPKQESDLQLKLRKDFRSKASKKQPQKAVEQQEERPAVVEEEDQPEVAEERPQDVAEDDQKYAEEHSAKRTEGEYNKLYQSPEASKAKESERKKSAYQLKKEAKKAEEEAEERRRNPEPEISDALKEELRAFAEENPGHSPQEVAELFQHGIDDKSTRITEELIRREGLETPPKTPYRQSGRFKVGELIRRWLTYQQKYNKIIKPVPKGSIPVDESQAGKANYNSEQLKSIAYYADKDGQKNFYDDIPEGSSMIPSALLKILWANNVVYKDTMPSMKVKPLVYYLQTKYGLK